MDDRGRMFCTGLAPYKIVVNCLLTLDYLIVHKQDINHGMEKEFWSKISTISKKFFLSIKLQTCLVEHPDIVFLPHIIFYWSHRLCMRHWWYSKVFEFICFITRLLKCFFRNPPLSFAVMIHGWNVSFITLAISFIYAVTIVEISSVFR